MHEQNLLISDVDNTLLGDDVSLRIFSDWLQGCRDRLSLVYSSGRFCASIRESVETTELPPPDAIIGGVGTEIRTYDDDALHVEWQRMFDVGWDPDIVRAVISPFEGPVKQPDEFISKYKISYYWEGATSDNLHALDAAFRKAGVSASIIYSSNRDLDILPAAAGKGAAASYLASRWNFPDDRVLVSGDSGNDRSMFEHDFRGIVVANAHDELKALQHAHVYHSPHTFAAGVLDGLRYWTSADSTDNTSGSTRNHSTTTEHHSA